MPRTNQPGHDHDVCPKCGAELCGGLIPESMGYPAATRCFSQVVGVVEGDRVVAWSYPCCLHREERQ